MGAEARYVEIADVVIGMTDRLGRPVGTDQFRIRCAARSTSGASGAWSGFASTMAVRTVRLPARTYEQSQRFTGQRSVGTSVLMREIMPSSSGLPALRHSGTAQRGVATSLLPPYLLRAGGAAPGPWNGQDSHHAVLRRPGMASDPSNLVTVTCQDGVGGRADRRHPGGTADRMADPGRGPARADQPLRAWGDHSRDGWSTRAGVPGTRPSSLDGPPAGPGHGPGAGSGNGSGPGVGQGNGSGAGWGGGEGCPGGGVEAQHRPTRILRVAHSDRVAAGRHLDAGALVAAVAALAPAGEGGCGLRGCGV